MIRRSLTADVQDTALHDDRTFVITDQYLTVYAGGTSLTTYT